MHHATTTPSCLNSNIRYVAQSQLSIKVQLLVVSLVISSVGCLTCSSASFSFVFILLAWIRSSQQALAFKNSFCNMVESFKTQYQHSNLQG